MNLIHFMHELLDIHVQVLPVVYIKNDVKMLIVSQLSVNEMLSVLTDIFLETIRAGFDEKEVN